MLQKPGNRLSNDRHIPRRQILRPHQASRPTCRPQLSRGTEARTSLRNRVSFDLSHLFGRSEPLQQLSHCQLLWRSDVPREDESQLTQAFSWEVRTSSTAAQLPTISAVRRPAGRRLQRAPEESLIGLMPFPGGQNLFNSNLRNCQLLPRFFGPPSIGIFQHLTVTVSRGTET